MRDESCKEPNLSSKKMPRKFKQIENTSLFGAQDNADSENKKAVKLILLDDEK